MILGERVPTTDDIGRTRAFVRFAWFPKRVSCGRRVWLERYVVVQRVASLGDYGGIAGREAKWITDRLVPFNEFIP